MLNGRKLAGILIELAPSPQPVPNLAAVIGIGLNLRLPPDLPDDIRGNAAALTDTDLALPDANALLALLLAHLHEHLQSFTHQGFPGVRMEWLTRHANEGKEVRLLSDFAPPLDGYCRGIDDDGALLLETASGLQRIISGDVTLRIR